MIFNVSGHLKLNYKSKLNGEEVEIVKSYKHLGVAFNISESAQQTDKTLIREKALKSIFKIHRTFNGKPNSVKIGIKLFDSLIKPILLLYIYIITVGRPGVQIYITLKKC